MEHITLEEYKQEVFEIISYCAKNVTENDYIYFNEAKKANKNLNIVITSTLGLCGGYNIAVEKYVMNLVSKDDDLIVIGAKGINYFKDKGYNILDRYAELPPLNLKESLSTTLTNIALKEFDKGSYRKVNIIYTKFINSLTFEPNMVQLLPLTSVIEVPSISKELVLEPSAIEVLNNLIPFYLTTSIKGLLFESILSEQASRRTAMENATDNASELEDKLLLEYNKSRQASITQEITEISGAANAIK